MFSNKLIYIALAAVTLSVPMAIYVAMPTPSTLLATGSTPTTEPTAFHAMSINPAIVYRQEVGKLILFPWNITNAADINDAISIPLEQPNYAVSDVEFDFANAFLYLIEGPADRFSSFDKMEASNVDGMVVQVDLHTGRRMELLKQPNLIKLYVSPHGKRALVMHRVIFSDRGVVYNDIQLATCILDLATFACPSTSQYGFFGLTWLDDNHIISQGPENLWITDVVPDLPAHGNLQGLENWIVADSNAIAPIPNTHRIVLEASPVNSQGFNISFVVYDADTHQATLLPINPIEPNRRLPSGISVSPHGKYFGFCYNYPDLAKCELVDLNSGQLLREFPNWNGNVWTPDDKILNGTTLIDPATGRTTTVPDPGGTVIMRY